MRKIIHIGILIQLASFHGDAVSCDAGDAWVVVDGNGTMGEDWRRQSETGFRSTYLDINGDGAADQASMVISSDSARSAIKICFGSKTPGTLADCEIVGEGDNVSAVMGLERRPAGCYEFYEDDLGSRIDGRVCAKYDVLGYFRFGSAGSFFIYDEKHGNFNRYWDSR